MNKLIIVSIILVGVFLILMPALQICPPAGPWLSPPWCTNASVSNNLTQSNTSSSFSLLPTVKFTLTVPDNTPVGEPICLTLDYNLKNGMRQVNSTTWTAEIVSSPGEHSYAFDRACLGYEASEEISVNDTQSDWYSKHKVLFEAGKLKEVSYVITKWRWLEASSINVNTSYGLRPDFLARVNNSVFMNGVSIIDFWWLAFGDPNLNITVNTARRAKLVGDYVNVFSVYTFDFDNNSVTLKKGSNGYGYTEDAIKYEIRRMQDAGLKVNLLNTIWQDLSWDNYLVNRSSIWWDSYFSTVREYLTSIARLSEELNVSMMQVGYDSDSLFGFIMGAGDVLPSDAVARWLDIIHEVRTIYHGKLIYTYVPAGLVDSDFMYHDELAPIFNEVDYIGVSWWRGMTANRNVSYPELVTAVPFELDKHLLPIYEKYGKPILFIPNFPSAYGGLTGVYTWNTNTVSQWLPDDGTFNDYQAQADALEVVMRAAAVRPWIAGVMPWGYWRIDLQDKSGNVRAKPAESVLIEWNKII